MDGGQEFETPQLSPAGFRAVWERLGAPRTLLLAVSGGSDSIAMMRLAAPLASEGLASIRVATVDHGLRAAARLEAESAGEAARTVGLSHEILNWRGDKPSSGLQAAARSARYGLLVRHAEAIAADAIMTAHTADDQAETVLMRLARGSGPRGLSGMAEESLIAAGASRPVRLLRPLLGARRAALRNFLSLTGALFIDDPSNEDIRFERVRVRRLIADLEAQGALSVSALVDTATEMRRAAGQIEAFENERFVELGGRFSPFGGATLSAALKESDAGLLARLIGAVSGGDFSPNAARAREALAFINQGKAATLGGVFLESRAGQIILSREAAAVLGRAGVQPLAPVLLNPGERVLWDGRFIVENRLGVAATLKPLGVAHAQEIGIEEPAAGGPALFVERVIAALPGESAGFEPLAAERFYRRVNRFQ